MVEATVQYPAPLRTSLTASQWSRLDTINLVILKAIVAALKE